MNQEKKALKHQKIQEISRIFFEDKTSTKKFNEYYRVLMPIVRGASKRILKDQFMVDDNVTKVFMKMYSNENFIFDNDKSHYSYVFNLAINMAKMAFNRTRRTSKDMNVEEYTFLFENRANYEGADREELDTILESGEFSPKHVEDAGAPTGRKKSKFRASRFKLTTSESELGNSNDGEGNLLEFLGHASGDFYETTNLDKSELFHDSIEKQAHMASKLIQKLPTEQREIFIDSISKVNYVDIKNKYGLNSEGAVKTRVHRIRRNLREKFNIEIKASLIKDGIISGGKHRYYFDDSNTDLRFEFSIIENELHGPAVEFYKNGCLRKEMNYNCGELHGAYREYNTDGTKKLECTYHNGFLHGKQIKFDNNKIDEVVDFYYGEKGYYELHEEGKVVESGIFE